MAEERPPAMVPEHKPEPAAPSAEPKLPESEIERRKRVAEDRATRLAENARNSARYSDVYCAQPSTEKPSIPVIVQTPRDRPLRLPGGRQVPSMRQVLVTKREMCILKGLSHRGVADVIVGKVDLAREK